MVKRPKMNAYVWIVLAVIIVPVAFVGGSYILRGATGYELYNEINTDLKLFDYGDYDDDPATGPVYTLLEYESSRVFTTLMVSVDVTYTEGLTGIKLYICKDADGEIGEAVVSVDMEKVASNTYKSTVDVDGWATDSYWAKISPTVSSHEISYTNRDYTAYWKYWDELTLDEQESMRDYWGGGPEHPDEPDEFIFEWKKDVFVTVDGPQKFIVKNPNKDLIFTFGIKLEDGTAYSGGGISQGMTFWVSVTTGVITHASLHIYEIPVKLVTSFSDINNAEFNMGGAQTNGDYYAKVILYGADGWNGACRNRDFTIDNPEGIAGTTTMYRATSTGWVVVRDGDQIGGDLKIEVVLTSGNAGSMTAVFESAGSDYRFPMSYDATDNTWKATLNTREMYNDYYTFYVEVVRLEDQSVSFLSGSMFDTKGGAMEIPIVSILIIVTIFGVVIICMMTGGFSALRARAKKKRRR